jgi:hypothetical protein
MAMPSPKRTKKAQTSPLEQSGPRPEVILDFVFDDGLFFMAVENIGDRPAFKVTVHFDSKIVGLGGSKEVSSLPLFQNIEFMAPHKRIMTFLDSSAAYFSRGEPTRISVKITYKDAAGAKYETPIRHDLKIYKDISYLPRNGTRKSELVNGLNGWPNASNRRD